MKKNKGFTLIELIVVTAIISLLASIAISFVGTSNQKASDIGKIRALQETRTALNIYFNDSAGGNGSYPNDINILVEKKYIQSINGNIKYNTSECTGTPNLYCKNYKMAIPLSRTDNKITYGTKSDCNSIVSTNICYILSSNYKNYSDATGGTITTNSNYTIHTFTSSGTFKAPSGVNNVEVLVVAGGGSGGGAGGNDGAGGGGGGGLIYNPSYSITPKNSIDVIVGAGGIGVSNATLGNNGQNSVFGTLIALGGGGGGSETNSSRNGKSGGSGGGAGGYSTSWVGGTGTSGQGYAGGANGNTGMPGGGGGAGEVGTTGSTVAGKGGDGLSYSISGTSTYYAGGGGGSGDARTNTSGGTGGNGGGGNGASAVSGGQAQNGIANTGGGGGGAAGSNSAGIHISGAGGSGIVIVRYITPKF